MRIEFLVLHCTATPAGRWVTPAEVRRWHTAPPPKGRGWSQVGYSDLILLDGTRHRFVKHDADAEIDPWEVTNGVAGINSRARHACYVGGVSADLRAAADTRTPAQSAALLAIVKEVLAYAPWVRVAGHNQFSPKSCPSFDTVAWLRSIGVGARNIYAP